MSQDPKSDLQKKPGRKKNTDAKMTLKFFFSGIGLELWGNDRLWSNFYKEGSQAISHSNR